MFPKNNPDHSFDHLQVWTTWELWTLRHEKARISDEKAPKSTQNEAKDCCCFLGEQDAAGLSPVTSTKITDLISFWGQIGLNLINLSPEAVYRSTVMPD